MPTARNLELLLPGVITHSWVNVKAGSGAFLTALRKIYVTGHVESCKTKMIATINKFNDVTGQNV